MWKGRRLHRKGTAEGDDNQTEDGKQNGGALFLAGLRSVGGAH